MGLIAKFDSGISVAEYFEAVDALYASDDKGRPLYPLGNGGMYLFTMDFVEKASAQAGPMPLHVAEKVARVLVQKGDELVCENKPCFKFETFIFDHFKVADRIGVLACDRSRDFAALKSPSDLLDIQKMIQNRDIDQLKMISGIEERNKSFELAPEFYYPTTDIVQRWKGKSLDMSGWIPST